MPGHAGAAGRVRRKAIRASACRVWGIGEGAPSPTWSARRQWPHQRGREDPARPLVARRTSPD